MLFQPKHQKVAASKMLAMTTKPRKLCVWTSMNVLVRMPTALYQRHVPTPMARLSAIVEMHTIFLHSARMIVKQLVATSHGTTVMKVLYSGDRGGTTIKSTHSSALLVGLITKTLSPGVSNALTRCLRVLARWLETRPKGPGAQGCTRTA